MGYEDAVLRVEDEDHERDVEDQRSQNQHDVPGLLVVLQHNILDVLCLHHVARLLHQTAERLRLYYDLRVLPQEHCHPPPHHPNHRLFPPSRNQPYAVEGEVEQEVVKEHSKGGQRALLGQGLEDLREDFASLLLRGTLIFQASDPGGRHESG